jgi:hypothetical protein
VLKKW